MAVDEEHRGAQVFDVGRCRQLTACSDAIGQPAFKQEGLELCTSGVDSSRMRGGSRADDADLGVKSVC